MSYFVTGATGFIGRFLVEQAAQAQGHDLRAGAQGLAKEARRNLQEDGLGRQARGGHRRRHDAGQVRRRRSADPHTVRQGEALLPPGRDLRPHRQARSAEGGQSRRYAACAGPRGRVEGRRVPPHQLDRRGRPVSRRVPRRHVRRGRRPGRPLPAYQARLRRPGAPRNPAEVAHLPAGYGRGSLADRRDGQDRRSVLLLHVSQEAAADAAAVDADARPGRWAHQHRAGRLRGRRDGPHRAQAAPGRSLFPSHRPRTACAWARC